MYIYMYLLYIYIHITFMKNKLQWSRVTFQRDPSLALFCVQKWLNMGKATPRNFDMQ